MTDQDAEFRAFLEKLPDAEFGIFFEMEVLAVSIAWRRDEIDNALADARGTMDGMRHMLADTGVSVVAGADWIIRKAVREGRHTDDAVADILQARALTTANDAAIRAGHQLQRLRAVRIRATEISDIYSFERLP